VVSVAKFVGAHGFIQRLPQGYNTIVGERGRGLSTGQRQLLSIARALIRNPRILILDEATSALDPATEEQLLRQLKNNTRGRTLIMITHRLAPLAIADRVAVVMDGRIERVGPPTEIMAYARIRMAEATREER
jgi:ABC-type multidrug transport system fused ATPase/permease subunit